LSELTTLREAVAGLVHDGDAVALEGFTHLIPTAAAHEMVRQEKRDLRERTATARRGGEREGSGGGAR